MVLHHFQIRRSLPELGPVARAVLFHGLPGDRALPRADVAWRHELPVLLDEGLAPLALESARSVGVDLPADVTTRLVEAQAAVLARSLRLESDGARAQGALLADGIPSVVLKGPGIRLADPRPRAFDDIDLIVARCQHAGAVTALSRHGWKRRAEVAGRRWLESRVGHASTLTGAGRSTIDLHWVVNPLLWGRRIPFDEIHRRATHLDGGPLLVAGCTDNLLVTALQAHTTIERDGFPLKPWRDVAVLLRVADGRDLHDLGWAVWHVAVQLPTGVVAPELLAQLDRQRLSCPVALRLSLMTSSRLRKPFASRSIIKALRLPLPRAGLFLLGHAVPSRRSLRLRYGSERHLMRWWCEAFVRAVAPTRAERIVRNRLIVSDAAMRRSRRLHEDAGE